MNSAVTLEEAGLTLDNERPLEGALAFLASRSKKSARQLSIPAGEVFNGIAAAVDQLLLSVIEKRTAVEYNAIVDASFPKYVSMTMALSQFAQAMVPANVIDSLTRDSICELEADFRDKALIAFGGAVRDQAMFTIWTLRKINDLLAQISAVKPDESKREDDRNYCSHFNFYSLRAHFALDCLNLALHLERPIYPEVTEELQDGLRSMVNAYAWARRGADLRLSRVDAPLEMSTVDEDSEDEELLGSSMQDMASMHPDEGS